MKITLIEPRGFCFGVCRALKMLDDLLPEHPYVLHEIVHNKQIVGDYQQKGVCFVENLDQVPPKAHLVLSAHGVTKEIEKKARQNFTVTDTTCPFVKKNHRWVQELEAKGIPVILIGKASHAEIIGLLGQLKQKAFIISNEKDVDALPNFDCVGVATQTTLSVDDTQQIVLALQKKYKNILFQNGVCMATQERQKAVKQAALTNQLIIVVGDKKSSNANRLVEVAKSAGADSVLVETVEDLKNMSFPDTIAITAAASAPERIVAEILDFLKRY
ncbi:MAG: 4-hydroxy-3-methylbut-2-enyl diphosphate reductase [Alphaproteobacteria bacterium]|nr:4-hydroxy-3-methylbut-2-enyl diphosphate reductase [Alphaproteobacteria bacterium]